MFIIQPPLKINYLHPVMSKRRMSLHKPSNENYELDTSKDTEIISIFKQHIKQRDKHPHIVDDPFYADYLKTPTFKNITKFKIGLLRMTQLRIQYFYFLELAREYKNNLQKAFKLLADIGGDDAEYGGPEDKYESSEDKYRSSGDKYSSAKSLEASRNGDGSDKAASDNHDDEKKDGEANDEYPEDDVSEEHSSDDNNSSEEIANILKSLPAGERMKIIVKKYIALKSSQLGKIHTIMEFLRIIYNRTERSYWHYKEIDQIINRNISRYVEPARHLDCEEEHDKENSVHESDDIKKDRSGNVSNNAEINLNKDHQKTVSEESSHSRDNSDSDQKTISDDSNCESFEDTKRDLQIGESNDSEPDDN